MKIAMINGSPKLGKNSSSILLRILETLIPDEHEIAHYALNKKDLTPEQYSELCRMDTLVLAFPLYVDGIPSHLFRMLVGLEEYLKAERQNDIYVYVMVNNGFFEGKQNHIAIDIIKNWCLRSGLHFGHAIGQGAGEMMEYIEKVPLGHGPLKNLGSAMTTLANHIHSHSSGESILISPNFPRFAWRFAATHTFWNAKAKKNGLKKKDILRRL
ncbi:multimeric flavodoxin WrbA [Fontibacillus phaseoli]|uniref:Multimeric flavodoxin WrbA n=1 Tax=Fontibacillus phaseoli TaxID=1416533 RepID=A0A369BJV0_9BACL|nr:hypothetical protein [Fontibacillus phaseoli]RCX20717.1 multimeric flavodoxin WrbA [Fontibacillus phaseoli]